MGNCVIIGENYAEAATLSGGSYTSALTNLQNRDTRIVARTTNALTGSTKIIADLGAAYPIGGVALININNSFDSTYRLRIGNDAGFTINLYDSGAGTNIPGFVVSPSLLDPSDPDYADGVLRHSILTEFPLSLVHVLSSDYTARYVEIDFVDTANADTWLEYGYLMIGRAYRFTYNYVPQNNATGLEAWSDMQESIGLKRVYNENGLLRTFRAAFENLTTDEAMRYFTRMMVKSRDSRPLVVVPDPADVLHLQYRAFLSTFKVLPPIMQSNVDRASLAVEFRELV